MLRVVQTEGEPWGAAQLSRHVEAIFPRLPRQLVVKAGIDEGFFVILLQVPCCYAKQNAVPGYSWGGETEIFKIQSGKKGTVRSGVSLFLR